MNTLSWFIYFADIISNFTVFLGLIIVVLIIVTTLVYIFSSANCDSYGNPKFVNWKLGHKLLCFLFILGVVQAVIPSKNTMYAIAASELGEAAVKSNLGQKSLQALENWINKQIPTNTDKETK